MSIQVEIAATGTKTLPRSRTSSRKPGALPWCGEQTSARKRNFCPINASIMDGICRCRTLRKVVEVEVCAECRESHPGHILEDIVQAQVGAKRSFRKYGCLSVQQRLFEKKCKSLDDLPQNNLWPSFCLEARRSARREPFRRGVQVTCRGAWCLIGYKKTYALLVTNPGDAYVASGRIRKRQL